MTEKEKALFEKAVEDHSDTVTGLCLFRLGSRQDAEDCYQNVFLKLFRNSGILETEPEHLKAWIIRVTLNECKNMCRFRFRHKTEPLEFINEYYESDNERGVMEEIMSLPPMYREVMYLHYCAGYSVSELSKLLRCSENTVKSRLYRGREKLGKIIDADRKEKGYV